jgi:hypothetical protein
MLLAAEQEQQERHDAFAIPCGPEPAVLGG